MPVMDEGVVVSSLEAFSVLVLRVHCLIADDQLVPAHILKMLEYLAEVIKTTLFIGLSPHQHIPAFSMFLL